MSRVLDSLAKSKAVGAVLAIGAMVSCILMVLPAEAQSVTGQVMSEGQMEIFGGWTVGTHAAFITVLCIGLWFLQNMYQLHAQVRMSKVHEREAVERTKQAAIYSESLHENSRAVNGVEKRVGSIEQKIQLLSEQWNIVDPKEDNE